MTTPHLPRYLFAGTEILGAAFSGFAVILVLWGKAPPRVLRMVTTAVLVCLVVRTLFFVPIPGETGTDYDVFRRAGQKSLSGWNPYQTDPVRWAPLNPPTA